MNTKIVMIKLSELEAHPDNPRKNIGDVSELADSIRESGIMQNLTVVPYEGKYRVVIGHRRMAAAKEASLTEVPCVIADMDYKTQISTMIAENMQRADLTITEQAEGIQMMFDMGEDINTVVKKTGLSRTTVERRKTLAQFDLKKVAEGFEKGATLDDYIEISKFEDEEDRKKLLKIIGTNNFKWEIDRIKEREDARKRWMKAREILSGKAEEVKYDFNKHEQFNIIYFSCSDFLSQITQTIIQMPKEKKKLYYIEENTYGKGYIRMLYPKEIKKSETKAEEEKKQEELQKRKMELKNLSYKIKESHIEFCKGIRVKSFTELKEFFAFFIKNVWNFDIEDCLTFYEFEDGDEDCEFFELEEVKKIMEYPEALAMISLVNDRFPCTWDYYAKYDKYNQYEETLQWLEAFGYVQSDEEIAYFDGTHELYAKEEEE